MHSLVCLSVPTPTYAQLKKGSSQGFQWMMQYAGAASDMVKAKQSIEDAKALTEKAKTPDEKVKRNTHTLQAKAQ